MFSLLFVLLMCLCQTLLFENCAAQPVIVQHERVAAAHTNHLFDPAAHKNGEKSSATTKFKLGASHKRDRRQLDINVDASYDEQAGGAEISAEIIGQIWRSDSGNARLDGSAKYEQRFNHYTGNGMPKVGATLHYHYD